MLNDELSKDDRIRKEFNRLKRIFKDLPKEKKDTVMSLINNAAFMTITLEDLQEIINEKGYTEEYQNGANQFGVKKRSEIEIYNAMIKNQTTIIKQLADLLPEGSTKDVSEDILRFAFGGKK